jgi:hypothetical protein
MHHQKFVPPFEFEIELGCWLVAAWGFFCENNLGDG